MRRVFLIAAACAIVSIAAMLPPGAGAMTAGTASGVRSGLAGTGMVEPVVRVCRHRFFTSRRHCYIDRTRPPTVCHHIRRSSRMDCY
jgi:hypothetical protein